jgi:hemerythrin-like domain-containing protein
MSALMSWTDEHQMILELLGALQTYAIRLRSGASVDPVDLERFSEVFRELVDYRHHEKEEGIVMPLLARNGFAWSSGLLAELRREHGHLRYLLDVLSQSAAKDTGGSREERRQIAEAAVAFVEFKRQHILKEETQLLPAIEQQLDARALEQLGAELAQFDSPSVLSVSRSGETLHVLGFASELVQRYSQGSGMVDVSGVNWPAAASADRESAWRSRLEARASFTSFGRSR